MKADISKFEHFCELHKQGILAIPTAWDAGSARVFERAGFPAVGTTSVGIARSLGFDDSALVSREDMLSVVARIAGAVSIPVTADIESGYGATPEEVAETVRLAIEAGVVGVNIEDSTGGPDTPLRPTAEHAQRIRAARMAADRAGVRLFINGRTDVFWLRREIKTEERVREATERAIAYLEAGADGIFVSGRVKGADTIAALAKAIPAPVNILVNSETPSVAELEKLGVRRVTMGSGPMRATMGLLKRIGEEYRDHGTYELMLKACQA